VREPRLLLLDEPTTGLDPGGMRDMRRLVRRLAEQGITVLLSSHLMGEVEELCDRVAIVRTGRVVYEGSLAELLASTAGRYLLRTTDDMRAAALAADRHGVTDVRFADGGLTLSAGDEAVTALSIALGEAGIGIAALVPRTATLEELFFRMTEGDATQAPVGAEREGVLR
jgi:ABC-2 type transport system ATP-binding protein